MKPFTNTELLAIGEKLKLVLPIEEFVFRKRTETALEITIVIKNAASSNWQQKNKGIYDRSYCTTQI